MRLLDAARVDALLDRFGGTRIVHGHTPIASVRGVDPRQVTARSCTRADACGTSTTACSPAGRAS